MTRVIIHMHNTLIQFWAKAINIAWYAANKIFSDQEQKKTSYDLWTERKPNLKYLGLLAMNDIY